VAGLAEEGVRPELGAQQHPDDQLAGVRERRLRVRGERHLAARERREAGFDYGVLPIPASGGGSAAAPTGGEFVTIPVQGDTGRYATSQKLATCLTSTQNLYDTDTTLSYVAPTTEVQEKQVAANPELKPWVDAVKAAKGRTSDDLGTKYPKISEQLWKAVQSALSGSKSPKDALTAAQSAVK
jgi:multiple sugar transport system substrate-binding protein